MTLAWVDNSLERTFWSFLAPDLLSLDDLGLHRTSSFVITRNRAVEEWLELFEDPILGNSALDRLANASYQIVTEGSSYRERQSPHRALMSAAEGD